MHGTDLKKDILRDVFFLRNGKFFLPDKNVAIYPRWVYNNKKSYEKEHRQNVREHERRKRMQLP